MSFIVSAYTFKNSANIDAPDRSPNPHRDPTRARQRSGGGHRPKVEAGVSPLTERSVTRYDLQPILLEGRMLRLDGLAKFCPARDASGSAETAASTLGLALERLLSDTSLIKAKYGD